MDSLSTVGVVIILNLQPSWTASVVQISKPMNEPSSVYKASGNSAYMAALLATLVMY